MGLLFLFGWRLLGRFADKRFLGVFGSTKIAKGVQPNPF